MQGYRAQPPAPKPLGGLAPTFSARREPALALSQAICRTVARAQRNGCRIMEKRRSLRLQEAPMPAASKTLFTTITPPYEPFMRDMSALPSLRSSTSASSDPPESVTSATSLAMAVPCPIAIPTSAAERAGESFTPSPTMTTQLPSARRASTTHACLPAACWREIRRRPRPRRCAPQSARCRRSTSRHG